MRRGRLRGDGMRRGQLRRGRMCSRSPGPWPLRRGDPLWTRSTTTSIPCPAARRCSCTEHPGLQQAPARTGPQRLGCERRDSEAHDDCIGPDPPGPAAVTGSVVSAEARLARLLDRLVTAAETSLAVGDLEPARAMAEEVCAVDPENRRAGRILRQVTRQLRPSGERVLMTLLFSDLVGSTALSERVEPEQLRDLFTWYRGAAREAVDRYNGN